MQCLQVQSGREVAREGSRRQRVQACHPVWAGRAAGCMAFDMETAWGSERADFMLDRGLVATWRRNARIKTRRYGGVRAPGCRNAGPTVTGELCNVHAAAHVRRGYAYCAVGAPAIAHGLAPRRRASSATGSGSRHWREAAGAGSCNPSHCSLPIYRQIDIGGLSCLLSTGLPEASAFEPRVRAVTRSHGLDTIGSAPCPSPATRVDKSTIMITQLPPTTGGYHCAICFSGARKLGCD